MPDPLDLIPWAAVLAFATAWMRERRAGRKDSGELALQLIEGLRQDNRDLWHRIGLLEGELAAERRQSVELQAAKLKLEAELSAQLLRRRAGDP